MDISSVKGKTTSCRPADVSWKQQVIAKKVLERAARKATDVWRVQEVELTDDGGSKVAFISMAFGKGSATVSGAAGADLVEAVATAVLRGLGERQPLPGKLSYRDIKVHSKSNGRFLASGWFSFEPDNHPIRGSGTDSKLEKAIAHAVAAAVNSWRHYQQKKLCQSLITPCQDGTYSRKTS